MAHKLENAGPAEQRSDDADDEGEDAPAGHLGVGADVDAKYRQLEHLARLVAQHSCMLAAPLVDERSHRNHANRPEHAAGTLGKHEEEVGHEPPPTSRGVLTGDVQTHTGRDRSRRSQILSAAYADRVRGLHDLLHHETACAPRSLLCSSQRYGRRGCSARASGRLLLTAPAPATLGSLAEKNFQLSPSLGLSVFFLY